MNIIFYIALTLTVFLVVALLLAPILLKPSDAAKRLLEVVQSPRNDQRKKSTKEEFEDNILKMAKALRVRLGMGEDARLKQRLISAGLKGSFAADVYLGFRVFCPLLGILMGSFMPSNTAFWAFAMALVGYLVPDIWLGIKIKGRRKRIRKGIPDTVDLLCICVDAGLGLDQALLRVGQELELSYPAINEELMQINLEQRAGKPRLEAWQSMADRTQIEEFGSFVAMLTQTDRFGTPILKALNRFSEDIRLKRRQRAEEAASQTKIKILFPLVLFIFPCIFIVLLAPAVLSIAKGMATMNGK
jgi:tight adherence protein C